MRGLEVKEGMEFHPGFEVVPKADLSFEYGSGVFGPVPEMRRLEQIRNSLLDPRCDGPDPVYGIAMDVGLDRHRDELRKRNLLMGVVTYASGKLGEEPVRSQGHIHAIASHSGWSSPELFEIWDGSAIIYAQERAEDDPGRCFAVFAKVGDQVIVPPGWAHCVINADPSKRMTFGAWCDREYGFDYRGVRAHRGLAWFALVPEHYEKDADPLTSLHWVANPTYHTSTLIRKVPNSYCELGIDSSRTIYEQFAANPDAIQWISEPSKMKSLWTDFTP